MLEVKIKYLDDIEKIEKIAIGDWIDLRASKDISLKKGEFTCIPLGVSIVLPDGYEALLAQDHQHLKSGIYSRQIVLGLLTTHT